jgi:hypothetical protein
MAETTVEDKRDPWCKLYDKFSNDLNEAITDWLFDTRKTNLYDYRQDEAMVRLDQRPSYLPNVVWDIEPLRSNNVRLFTITTRTDGTKFQDSKMFPTPLNEGQGVEWVLGIIKGTTGPLGLKK